MSLYTLGVTSNKDTTLPTLDGACAADVCCDICAALETPDGSFDVRAALETPDGSYDIIAALLVGISQH